MALALNGNLEVKDVMPTLAGSYMLLIADITLDTNYPTGGSPGLTRLLGLNKIFALVALSHSGYLFEHNPTTDKLKVWQQSGAAGIMSEVTNTTNLSANTIRVLVFGQ